MRDNGCIAAWKNIVLWPSAPGAQRWMHNWCSVMGASCWLWLVPQTTRMPRAVEGTGTGAAHRGLVGACGGGGGTLLRRRGISTVRDEELVDGCLIPSSGI